MKISGIEIEFQFVETLPGGGPAKCRIVVPNRYAIITLALSHWRQLSKKERLFTILHELGHIVLNIGDQPGDEAKVDRWAHKQYSKMGYSQRRAFYAISNQLDPINNPEHEERTIQQFYRCKHRNFLNGHTTWRQFINQKH